MASRAVFAAPRARGNERVCADLGQFPNPFQVRGGTGAPVVVGGDRSRQMDSLQHRIEHTEKESFDLKLVSGRESSSTWCE